MTFRLFVCLVVIACGAARAAPFVNLDFEQVTTNRVETLVPGELRGYGPIEDLIPGWSLTNYLGNRAEAVNFNLEPTGANFFGVVSQDAVVDPSDLRPFRKYFPLNSYPDGLAGRFGIYVNVGGEKAYLLTQRGDVPREARLFSTDAYVAPGMRIEIRMDGLLIQQVEFELSDGPASPPVRFQNVDVSSLAGKNVELQLKFLPVGAHSDFHGGPSIGLDGLSFLGDLGLRIARGDSPTGGPPEAVVQFNVLPGQDYIVEFRDDLESNSSWQSLPGAPHNSGSVADTAANPQRIYRVHSVPSAGGMTVAGPQFY